MPKFSYKKNEKKKKKTRYKIITLQCSFVECRNTKDFCDITKRLQIYILLFYVGSKKRQWWGSFGWEIWMILSNHTSGCISSSRPPGDYDDEGSMDEDFGWEVRIRTF